MATFRRAEVVLEYSERGNGFPVLLLAPGGMRSAASFWEKAPWNPLVELSDQFRVIAMDQRNAGGSSAPVRPGDGWQVYAEDQVALLDHLGIARCHVVGGCIGGAFALGLIKAAPGRVAAAVLQQPIGSDGQNRSAFYEMFDGWVREVAARQPQVSPDTWRAFRSAMYDGHFTFNVDRDFVRGCEAPLLVLMGNDLYHPQVTSREIAALAPRAELVESWKDPAVVGETVKRVRRFLEANTPR
jgi:pimeloyl-ACP methyl ester carboxylesterase